MTDDGATETKSNLSETNNCESLHKETCDNSLYNEMHSLVCPPIKNVLELLGEQVKRNYARD